MIYIALNHLDSKTCILKPSSTVVLMYLARCYLKSLRLYRCYDNSAYSNRTAIKRTIIY